jgi:hypothetical protein
MWYRTDFVKFYMAQQNIHFDKLLNKSFEWGPPETFFFTAVVLQIFEVAPIINLLSEAYQN